MAKEIETKIREKASAKAATPGVEEPVEDKKVEHISTRKRGGA